MEHSRTSQTTLIDEVSERIEDNILAGEYAPDNRLPSESALARELQVSRPVLREALSKLRERGYIDTQNGVGTFVQFPSSEHAVEGMRRHMEAHLQGTYTIDQFYEARRSIESAVAMFAAARISDDYMKRLEMLVEEMRLSQQDSARYANADVQFHLTLAESTDNPLLQLLLSPLVEILIKGMFGSAENPAARESGLKSHMVILDRLRTRDPEAARVAMVRHIEASRELFPLDVIPSSPSLGESAS